MDSRFQPATNSDLVQMLQKEGYWTKMHSKGLLEKVQSSRPAVIAPGGVSLIISYYDEHLHYLCTIHRVVNKEGVIIHEDVKDAFINGTRYRASVT